MAVTITGTPNSYTPSDNPIVWQWSSNQTGQPNFSFVVEVYVNNVLDSRHEVFPEVGTRAHFDVCEIMRRSTPVASVVQNTMAKDAGNHATVYVKIIERYGVMPVLQASTTTAAIRAFKASLPEEVMETWNHTDYRIGSPTRKFMTDNTNDLRIQPDKDYFLTIITAQTSGLTLVYKLFKNDGTQLGGADLPISSTYYITQLNLRTAFLVGFYPQSLFDQADYLEFYVELNGGANYSETKRYYMDRSTCGKPAHFVWINRFGAFDCFTFMHNTIFSGNVSSKTFEKQFGGWEGNAYVLNAQNSGLVDYMKTQKEQMKAVSDIINEAVQNYLVTSMYNSPLCYLRSATKFRRVRVENTSYDLQDDDYEEEFTETVEVSFPNTNKSVTL